MFLKRISSHNVGPIGDIDVCFEKNNNGMPKPVVLVGENGAGKSTIMSNIVDSMFEMARMVYDDAVKQDGYKYQYYKAINHSEIRVGEDYMISYVEYEDCEKDLRYVFKGGSIEKEKACGLIKNQLDDIGNWEIDGNYKAISGGKNDYDSIFNSNVLCFFGPDRYEKPIWLGNKYYEELEHLSINGRFSGEMVNNIVAKNVSDSTLKWLLDVIVDSRTDIIADSNGLHAVHSNINDVLNLGIARQNIEKVMSEILGREVFFGLNFRSSYGNRFNIKEKETETEKTVIPTLDSLSTGQSALFNMFSTIIRYADNLNINRSIRIEEIKGIVIIDEIDLHLHTKLQREVLPKLLNLFPNIQFIISTHSPMFLLGMDEFYGKEGYCIYELPEAKKITSEMFGEFQRAYTYMTMTEKYQKEIKNEIQLHIEKTLIVTEGATDWRHLKAALCKSSKEEYKALDIEFLEYNPKNSKKEDLPKLNMSNSHLTTMCKEFAKVRQSRKIIFIADADDPTTNKELGGMSRTFKDWRNNVYSLILPVPDHRKETPRICIEHYYSDEDLRRTLEIDGIPRRIFIGSEFDNFGLSIDKKYMCLDRNNCGLGTINIIDGQTEKRVFMIEDEEKKNLALTKMDFAEAIYGNVEGFCDIDFKNYSLVFDIISEIERLPIV